MSILKSYHFETEESEPQLETKNSDVLSLKQLMDATQRAVEQAFFGPVWVVAEISEISPPKSGHVYLTLIEKVESGQMVAKTRASIWQSRVRAVMHGFREVTGTSLTAGMKVLLQAEPSMHAVFGFSLNILQIDPEYTLGELERERRATIDRLVKEAIIDKNKQIEMPIVAQRIAVISSGLAAGYEDFVHQLARNSEQYRFTTQLFPALMQGDAAPDSILSALKAIMKRKEEFDVVVIIRGGGAKIDLHCFDSYEVARAIAWTQLPVITGIGHERDDSVADMVANTRCKTPTAVAEFLICLAGDFEDAVLGMRERIVHLTRSRLHAAQSNVDTFSSYLREAVTRAVSSRSASLEHIAQSIKMESLMRLEREGSTLQRVVDKVGLLDPINVLRRGYSLVYSGESGNLVRKVNDISIGQTIKVRVANGDIIADVVEAISNDHLPGDEK